MPKFVAFYAVAEGGMSKVPANYPAHHERSLEFHRRGTLLMTGAFADPSKGAMAVFTTREAAEDFIRDDPFVVNGIVGSWSVQEWDEVVAGD